MPTFLNPALLYGLLGLSIPVVMHLIGRRQGKRVAFAAMDFLLASERRLAARRKFVNVLLLLARLALVAAIVLAVARPLLQAPAVLATGPVSLVAVIDRSLSMRAEVNGSPRFDRLKSALLAEIDRLPEASEVAVVVGDTAAKRLTPGFVSPREARVALVAVTAGYGRAEMAGAVREARAMLDNARHASRRLAVASDWARSSWEGFVPPQDIDFAPIDDGAAAPENRALSALALAPGEDREVVNLVAGHWPPSEAALTLVAELSAGGAVAARQLITVAPGQTAGQAQLALPAGLDAHEPLSFALKGQDAVADDDRRLVLPEPRAPVRVYAVDGEPAATVLGDELLYFGAAARAASNPTLALTIVDGTALTWPSWQGQDVVLLANVEHPDPAQAQALKAYVEEGHGLFITLGRKVDARAWNEALGSLLPGSLEAVESGPTPARLALPAADDPVVAPLATLARKEPLELRLEALYRVRPAADARTLVALADGRPLLLMRAVGKGKVALLTTSVDRDWTDLPMRPCYLPLLERTLRSLAGALTRPFPRSYLVGERVAFPAEAEAPLSVATPDGRALTALLGAAGMSFAETAIPGLYRAADAHGGRYDFVVNIDPRESDLRPLTGGPAKLARSTAAGASVPGAGRGTDLSLLLALVALAALVLESELARRR